MECYLKRLPPAGSGKSTQIPREENFTMKPIAILKAGSIGAAIMVGISLLTVILNPSLYTRSLVPSAVRWCGLGMLVLFLTGYLYGYFAYKADPASLHTTGIGGFIAAFLASLATAVFDIAQYYLSETIGLTPEEYYMLMHGSDALFLPLLVCFALILAGLVFAGSIAGMAGGMFFAARMRR
jgi:hypothetical protein